MKNFKFALHTSLAALCLILSAQAAAKQQEIPCPSPLVAKQYADRMDTVKAIMYDAFLVFSEQTIYDSQSNRYWSLNVVSMATYEPGFDSAWMNANTSLENIFEQAGQGHADQSYYGCEYSSAVQHSKIYLLTRIDGKQDSQNDIKKYFMKKLK